MNDNVLKYTNSIKELNKHKKHNKNYYEVNYFKNIVTKSVHCLDCDITIMIDQVV